MMERLYTDRHRGRRALRSLFPRKAALRSIALGQSFLCELLGLRKPHAPLEQTIPRRAARARNWFHWRKRALRPISERSMADPLPALRAVRFRMVREGLDVEMRHNLRRLPPVLCD